MSGSRIICGDALEQLKMLQPGNCRTCVTSPPYYGLRDYGVARLTMDGNGVVPQQFYPIFAAIAEIVRGAEEALP